MRKIILVAALAAAMPLVCLSQATDAVKRNEGVVRHFVESSNRRDVQSAVSDFAEDAKNIGRPGGRERMRHVLEDIYTTFPDYHYDIEEMIAQGDSVALRCKVSGTHRGMGKLPVNGGMLVGVEPTQKHFEIQHIHWFNLRDGKIVDHYATRNDIGMMQQLGLLPTPTPVPTNPK
jgi:steroid delta-isomerase-like uncharacterized protein